MVRPGAYLLARFLKLPPPRFAVSVKRDIPVMMPDGVRLFADHYRPRAAGAFPTILIRTPYGRGKEVAMGNGLFLAELPAQRFAERGYHVVVQGARGCFNSEGEFRPHVHEARDGLAAAEWIAAQPWFGGALGTWGPSYLGYMQWALAGGAPPYLKAMMIMLASAENHSVTHPDGAFGLETRLRWSQGMHSQAVLHRQPRRAQLRQLFSKDAERALQAAFAHLPLGEADAMATGEQVPFYRDLLAHTRSDDPFWVERDHSAAVGGVTAPVHLLGGWYDYYLRGLLRDYAALAAAGRSPYLTIGPWNHAHTGGMFAGLRAGLDWFDAHLKGDRSRLRAGPVSLYVMGAGEWRTMERFPPAATSMRLFLGAGGALSTNPPAAGVPPDCYRYDPADPTPALGGALLAMRGAGPVDNRPLEARPDVLCYTTLPLEHDLEIAGRVRLELHARSSLPHSDFFGRLCNVAPDGRSTNLCDGLFRVEPGRGEAQPDGNLRIEIDLSATAHRFRAGHRIRLQISSGAHPRWSRNLGTGDPLATGTRMQAADQAIFHDVAHPSAVVLPVTRG